MNEYITGSTIKRLREQNRLTQNELANLLKVSDKTISKWETGNGYPDIEMLEPLAKIFNVSIIELLNGSTITNNNTAGNLLKLKFYVCPICGNIITSVGESLVMCHGVNLIACQRQLDEGLLYIEKLENEYYVSINHSMSKDDYISFVCAVGSDGMQIKKLYPEQSCETYFRIVGVKYIYYYSNKRGLFYKSIK